MSVHFSDAYAGWAVGFNGTIAATHNGGTTWGAAKERDRPDSLGCAFCRSAHQLGRRGGTILATRDGMVLLVDGLPHPGHRDGPSRTVSHRDEDRRTMDPDGQDRRGYYIIPDLGEGYLSTALFEGL